MNIPTVIIVGADKGGVGKTTVTRVLLDYLTTKKITPRVFDTESPNGDLIRFAPNAEVIDISKMKGQMKVFDGAASAGVTVVDLRAGMLTPTIRALDEAMLLEDVRQGAINLVLLHVLGPTIASIGEVASAAQKIGGGAKHFLVKNHINETEFFDWDKDQTMSPLRSMGDVTITVKNLPADACEVVQKVGGSFLSFTGNAGQSRVLRGNTFTWLKGTWAEFDRVKISEIISPPAPPPVVETTGGPIVHGP